MHVAVKIYKIVEHMTTGVYTSSNETIYVSFISKVICSHFQYGLYLERNFTKK